MKEIGGYFGLEQFTGAEYHAGLLAVNTACGGLEYLLRARGIKKLYLPYYLCSSVSRRCEQCGCAYEYYHVGRDFLPVFDKELGEAEYLYVVNYYGQLDRETAIALQRRYRNVIWDNVQAFFQHPVAGLDTLYSCRKFFGVPDGAYVSTDARLPGELERDISMGRVKHLLGRFEENAGAYYRDFQRNEEALEDLPLREMSSLTHNLLRAVDYALVMRRREENYLLLQAALGPVNPLRLRLPMGPYAYPWYCEQAVELRARLVKEGIFIPTLWPNVLALEKGVERELAEKILPLPCDQRYDAADMRRLLSALSRGAGN